MTDAIKPTYRDPAHPASFGGVDALYRAVQGKVSRKKIQEWLQEKDAYTLHRPLRHRFPTNRVMVGGMDHQWQADLADVSHLRQHNGGFRYLLTCIDILSKYAWVIPLKQKTGTEVVRAFQKIFNESGRKPKKLQTDKGTEFTNQIFQKFLKLQKIGFFTTFNTTKASIVERFNRTYKSKMWKYFTHANTFHYLQVLDELTHSYNHTYHSSIKMSPVEVTTANEKDVWSTLYGTAPITSTKCTFKVGDVVRVSKIKLTFEKGYESNWSEELFIVTECVARKPVVYRIKDLLDEAIEGTFYKEELQKVKRKEHYPIEKILKKRKKSSQFEYFVKFRGYPDKFNQWVSSGDLGSL